MAWLFAFSALAIVVNHVPYQFYQGYLALAAEQWAPTAGKWAPLGAGLHLMIASMLTAWAAARSIRLVRALGLRAVMVGSLAAQIGLSALMGWVLDPSIAVLLVMRALPSGLQRGGAARGDRAEGRCLAAGDLSVGAVAGGEAGLLGAAGDLAVARA